MRISDWSSDVCSYDLRPFDLPAWSGFVSAEGTYSDTTKNFDPQIAGQISWKDPEERLGFLVGATYQERSNRELRGSPETWRWWSPRAADGNLLTPANQERNSDVGGKEGSVRVEH